MVAVLYGDEQTQYRHYIKNIKWIDEVQFVAVKYAHSAHGWGRINPHQSLSLSISIVRRGIRLRMINMSIAIFKTVKSR
jgi:hypothetical protein